MECNGEGEREEIGSLGSRRKSFHEMLALRDGGEGKVSSAVVAYEKTLVQQAPQRASWKKAETKDEEKGSSEHDYEGDYANLFDVEEEAAEQVRRSAGSETFCG